MGHQAGILPGRQNLEGGADAGHPALPGLAVGALVLGIRAVGHL